MYFEGPQEIDVQLINTNFSGIIVDSVSVDGPVLRRVHGAGDRGALQAGQERLQCRRQVRIVFFLRLIIHKRVTILLMLYAWYSTYCHIFART